MAAELARHGTLRMMPSWAAEAAGSKWRGEAVRAALTASSPAHKTLNLRNNGPANTRFTEHARLKDHVSSMEGGLEAKVNEGGKHLIPSVFFSPSHTHLLLRFFPVDAGFFSSSVTSFDRPHRLSRDHPRTYVTLRRPAGRTLLTPKFACRTGGTWLGVCVANYCGGHSCVVVSLLDTGRAVRFALHVWRTTREVARGGVPHPTGSGPDVPGSRGEVAAS